MRGDAVDTALLLERLALLQEVAYVGRPERPFSDSSQTAVTGQPYGFMQLLGERKISGVVAAEVVSQRPDSRP